MTKACCTQHLDANAHSEVHIFLVQPASGNPRCGHAEDPVGSGVVNSESP